MARAAEPFAEEVHYMKALYQEYNKRSDADAVIAVDQDLSDIFQACSTAEADVRQTIKELSRQVQELEGAAAYPHREGLHAERVAALQRQIDVAKQRTSADEQCKEVEKQLEAAAGKAQEEAASQSFIKGRLQHQLSMYKHITNTIWCPDSGRIAGNVSDAKAADVRPFSYEQDMDKFELVNKLWDLL
ncbi:hypothetical protein PLESTB_001473400 [Pleodorina starrii]|uniref:Kinetochore protein Spc24 n=1 Tax=Pleodorina starrii TaxID=330485 RepID=A0A9W6BWS9_9CHLO|nr:hypothetical protein PLESTM_000644800 [Pleodorina starrii]GLC59315.1 hypothetical protein PLESTB_001473400 [Pleodorina starrii]